MQWNLPPVRRKDKKLRTRQRIVEVASRGLLRTGANGMSVVNLMRLAGLTHGGFYAHFESRDDLVIEAFALAMDRTVSRWNKLKEEPAGIDAIIEWYLSEGHRDAPAQGCALPSLGTRYRAIGTGGPTGLFYQIGRDDRCAGSLVCVGARKRPAPFSRRRARHNVRLCRARTCHRRQDAVQ
jgi:AcrR family transcriptional regulator